MNTLREITFCFVYFGIYENLKANLAHVESAVVSEFRKLRRQEDEVVVRSHDYRPSPFAILIAGIFFSIFFSFFPAKN